MLRSVSHIRNKYTLASSPRLTLNRDELVVIFLHIIRKVLLHFDR